MCVGLKMLLNEADSSSRLLSLIDYLGVEQEYIFELISCQFVAVVFTADMQFPFLCVA